MYPIVIYSLWIYKDFFKILWFTQKRENRVKTSWAVDVSRSILFTEVGGTETLKSCFIVGESFIWSILRNVIDTLLFPIENTGFPYDY